MIIKEGKQVGDISYFVKELTTLYNIIKNNEIWTSEPEYNQFTHKNSKFVSFSRNLTSQPHRKPERWQVGIVIDGDKLSNKYHIEPVSYRNIAINKTKFRLASIYKYDSGKCVVSFKNFSSMNINEKIYNEIENYILSQPDEINRIKKLSHLGRASRPHNGDLRIDGYTYLGSVGLDLKPVKELNDFYKFISNYDKLDETEERVWTNKDEINIKGCIKYILLPEKYKYIYENPDNSSISIILELIKETNYYIKWFN